MSALPQTMRFDINKAIRRLYTSRVEADCVIATLSDRSVAVNSLRDLRSVLLLLGTDQERS